MIAELDATTELAAPVDVALYDAFAQPDTNHSDFTRLIAGARASAVVVYTWNFHPHLADDAISNGASGCLSKALPARQLVDAIEAIHAGEVVVSDAPRAGRLTVGLDWPGRSEGPNEYDRTGPSAFLTRTASTWRDDFGSPASSVLLCDPGMPWPGSSSKRRRR